VLKLKSLDCLTCRLWSKLAAASCFRVKIWIVFGDPGIVGGSWFMECQMIRINTEWRAKQLAEHLVTNRIISKATALSLSIVAVGLMGVSKVNASDVPLPIKKIGLNNENQIVVYFGKREGEFPSPPHLLDTPGPNHRIVIEFSDATVDKVNMPDAADLSTKLHKQLSGIKSIRYQTVATGDATRARVVIEVAEQLKVRPRVIKLEEDSVTINLADDIVEQSAALDGPVKGRSQSAQSTSMRSRQSVEPGAPSVIAQRDSQPEIPTPSNSDDDATVITPPVAASTSSSIDTSGTSAVAPSAVRSVASAASNVANSVASTTSTSGSVGVAGAAASVNTANTINTPVTAASTAESMPVLRTAPLPMPAQPQPAVSAASSVRNAVTDVESSSQVAESMPSSPKTKSAATSTQAIKMPETLTNAGANLKKFVHWPHKDDTTASASVKDSSSSKKDSSKKDESDSKEVADAPESKKDSVASKLGKMNFLSKLPKPGFAKSKSPEVVAAANVNTKKPASNTVVELGSGSSSSKTTETKASSSGSSKTTASAAVAGNQLATAQTTVTDAGSDAAPPEGAEFNAAFVSQAAASAAKSPASNENNNDVASAASKPAATSIPQSTDSAPAAPGSWDWTATQAASSKPVKQTSVSTASALPAAASSASVSSADAVVSKAINAANVSEVAEVTPSHPVQVAQSMPDDDRPKISTPIETTETQTFGEPAQMLTPGASTSVSAGAQEMMKIKAKEQEVKPVTVAETEKSDFAEALKSRPARKQKVEQETTANEPTLIRDTEMTDPAVEKMASKRAAESESPAGEMPAQVAPEAPAAAAAATELESAPEDKTKLARDSYNLAVKAHLSGKLSEAIAAYKNAIAANPELAEAHSNLGLIYNQQHKYELAVSEFQKALAVNPKDAITYNGIGAALRAQKDLPGAIKNWQTAVSLDPKLATAHYNLGVAYELQRDYDRSLTSYEEAIKCDYRLGEAYYRMGMILEKRHRTEDARAKFKAALKASENADYSADARQRLALLESKADKVIK
jgi:tetratricopeptide (TPR) repeat protein